MLSFLKRQYSAVLRRRRVAAPAMLAMVFGLFVSVARADPYTPPTSITFDTVIGPTVLVAGVLTLAGAALVAAFGIGGGFRVAKKAYSWIFGKI